MAAVLGKKRVFSGKSLIVLTPKGSNGVTSKPIMIKVANKAGKVTHIIKRSIKDGSFSLFVPGIDRGQAQSVGKISFFFWNMFVKLILEEEWKVIKDAALGKKSDSTMTVGEGNRSINFNTDIFNLIEAIGEDLGYFESQRQNASSVPAIISLATQVAQIGGSSYVAFKGRDFIKTFVNKFEKDERDEKSKRNTPFFKKWYAPFEVYWNLIKLNGWKKNVEDIRSIPDDAPLGFIAKMNFDGFTGKELSLLPRKFLFDFRQWDILNRVQLESLERLGIFDYVVDNAKSWYNYSKKIAKEGKGLIFEKSSELMSKFTQDKLSASCSMCKRRRRKKRGMEISHKPTRRSQQGDKELGACSRCKRNKRYGFKTWGESAVDFTDDEIDSIVDKSRLDDEDYSYPYSEGGMDMENTLVIDVGEPGKRTSSRLMMGKNIPRDEIARAALEDKQKSFLGTAYLLWKNRKRKKENEKLKEELKQAKNEKEKNLILQAYSAEFENDDADKESGAVITIITGAIGAAATVGGLAYKILSGKKKKKKDERKERDEQERRINELEAKLEARRLQKLRKTRAKTKARAQEATKTSTIRSIDDIKTEENRRKALEMLRDRLDVLKKTRKAAMIPQSGSFSIGNEDGWDQDDDSVDERWNQFGKPPSSSYNGDDSVDEGWNQFGEPPSSYDSDGDEYERNSFGVSMDKPDGVLYATGKPRRSVKVKPPKEMTSVDADIGNGAERFAVPMSKLRKFLKTNATGKKSLDNAPVSR